MLPPEHIWEGNVLSPESFRTPGGTTGFDAAVCISVLPHIPEGHDVEVIKNLNNAVQKNGLVAAVPEFFRGLSLAMEDPSDWRGYFMVSAFLLAGKVHDQRERWIKYCIWEHSQIVKEIYARR